MSIIDLLIADLQVEQLNEIQLMELSTRLLDIAIEKINKKEFNYEEE